LLRQAQNGGPATERFYRAANRYATTLRTLGGVPAVRAGTGVALPPGTGAQFMSGVDLASVSLINHGVKDALDSLQLKQRVRMMGGDTAADRALMDHARQMDAESRQAIDTLAVVDRPERVDAVVPVRPGATPAPAVEPAEGPSGELANISPQLRDGSFIIPDGAATAANDGEIAVVGNARAAIVPLLAQQARELLQAIRELDGNSR
jgi:hypothetical protein